MVAGSVMSAAVPGAAAWDIVVGDRFIVAIAAPGPDTVIDAFADAADDATVSIESLVGIVPTGRDDAVESFAIVHWPSSDPSAVTAVVRGGAVVDLASPGGARRFDARGVRPWHLADFETVVAVRLTAAGASLGRLGEAPDTVGHARAVVRASAVEWTAPPTPDAKQTADPADADTVLMLRRRARADDAGDGAPAPDAPSGDHGDRGPLPAEHAAADTILGSGRPPTEISRPAPRIHPDTSAQRVAPAQPHPAAPAPLEPPPPRRDAGADAPGFRVGAGATRRLSAPVLIGRSPLATRLPGASAPELVTVPSPNGVVSATHLALRLEGSRLVAEDLRSTNGTVVRTAAGSRRMRAGESIVVMPGTSLDLGDGTIIEIVSAPAAPPE